jgi:hypothetical protein
VVRVVALVRLTVVQEQLPHSRRYQQAAVGLVRNQELLPEGPLLAVTSIWLAVPVAGLARTAHQALSAERWEAQAHSAVLAVAGLWAMLGLPVQLIQAAVVAVVARHKQAGITVVVVVLVDMSKN